MFFNLHKKHDQLKDIFLITGTGLTSNIYILGKRELTLIDAGNNSEPNVLITELHKICLNIKDIAQIILTHTHFDHVGGLSELVRHVSPKIFVHETERSIISSMIGTNQLVTAHDGDLLTTEVGSLQVLHTPGHSPGAICLYDQSKHVLYSGDTVFPNGLFGRCDLKGGDARTLVQSLHRLRTLDPSILLPGHEYPVFHHARQHVELTFRNAQSYFS